MSIDSPTRSIDLKRLEAFVEVARLGSFRAAAQRLNATQPAVSGRVAQLERALGVRLLERTSRSCRLTPGGRRALAHAERMFAVASELRASAGGVDSLTGTLRIGVVDTVAMTWLPELLVEIERRMPKVAVELDVDLSANLLEQLRAHSIGLAIVVSPVEAAGVRSWPLGPMGLRWMASPELRLPAPVLTPQNLSEFPIVAHRGSRHASTVEAWIRRSGRAPPRFSACNSLATIVRLAQVGAGIALLPAPAVRDELRAGKLVLVPSRGATPPNELAIACIEGELDIVQRTALRLARAVASRRRKLR